MANKPSEDEKGDGAEFQETLENMLKMPPKPHVPLKKGREPKPAPERK